jgi:vacuolar-type H+-ATPase subunit E/Vma4
MSESGIARKILDSAHQKARAALAEAGRKKDELLHAELARLREELDEKKESAKKRLQESFQQEISAARLAEKNRLNSLKRSLLDAVYESAWRSAVASKALRRFTEQQIREHCKAGDTLVISPEQEENFRKDLAGVLDSMKVSISEERSPFRAGFIAVRGSIRLNCTLDEAFKSAVRDAEIEVARMLFGE